VQSDGRLRSSNRTVASPPQGEVHAVVDVDHVACAVGDLTTPADLRLTRSGLTLRRRRGGSDDGWHLKLPAGADSRDEVRLPSGRSRKPPEPLVALTRAAHRGARLEPVVEPTRNEW